MSESGGQRARLRRYPELPVWVVEDHQEVSGRLTGLGQGPRGLRRRRSLEARERTRIRASCIAVGKTPGRRAWKNRLRHLCAACYESDNSVNPCGLPNIPRPTTSGFGIQMRSVVTAGPRVLNLLITGFLLSPGLPFIFLWCRWEASVEKVQCHL